MRIAFRCICILSFCFIVSCSTGTREITIRWALDENMLLVGKELARAYMEVNPGQVVDIIPLSPDREKQKKEIQAHIVQHDVDIFTADTFLLHFLINNQYVTPVRTKMMEHSLSDYFEGFTKLCETNEQYLFALPWLVDTSVFFYREDLFADAGVPSPRTWDDVERAIIKIHSDNKKIQGFVLPASSEDFLARFFIDTLWSSGLDVITNDGDVMLELPQAVLLLKTWRKYLKENIFPSKIFGKLTKEKVIEEFVKGNISCYYGRLSDWHILNNQFQSSDMMRKIKFTFIPSAEGYAPLSILVPKLLALSSEARYQTQSIQFMNFLTSFPSQEILLMHDRIPALIKVFNESEAVQYKPEYIRMYPILCSSEALPLNRITPKILTILQQNLAAVIDNKKSPPEALYAATKSIQYLPRPSSIAAKKIFSSKKKLPVKEPASEGSPTVTLAKTTATVTSPHTLTGLVSPPPIKTQHNLTVPATNQVPAEIPSSEPQKNDSLPKGTTASLTLTEPGPIIKTTPKNEPKPITSLQENIINNKSKTK